MSKRQTTSTGNQPHKKQRVLRHSEKYQQPGKSYKNQDNLQVDPSITPKNTLYVQNLNDKIKINTLRESLYMLFVTYGEVLKVAVSPKHRGQAFIMFRTVDEANLALLSLKDELFFGKNIKLQFSKENTTNV